jgi:hypothetical protein
MPSTVQKIPCLFGKHNYVNCTCTRCGDVQDYNHVFRLVEGCCEEQCTVCGKARPQHQWSGIKCARCGASRIRTVDVIVFICVVGLFGTAILSMLMASCM